MEQSLSKVGPGSEFYLLGDINIDFKRSSSLLSSYKNILNLFNCTQMVNEPTRVTPTTSSTLDHVVTNVKGRVREAGVIAFGFSDRLVTYCSRGTKTQNSDSEPKIKKVRNLKHYNAGKLRIELAKIYWSNVLLSLDVEYCVNEFTRLLNAAVDAVAPFREIRVRNHPNPWMNSTILAGINQRYSLLSCFKKDRTNVSLYAEFCKVRNQVQRDIKMAKGEYFKNKVEQNKGDSGKLWGQLKSLGYSKVSGGSSKIWRKFFLEENGTKVFEPLPVSDIFNRFYTSVASELVSKLPSPSGLFSTSSHHFRSLYSRLRNRDSFVISPVSCLFIRKQLLSLNPKKAIGLDNLSSRFLCDAVDEIIEPVSHIVNLSISSETVPSSFKQARVIPLFKKGSKLDPSQLEF